MAKTITSDVSISIDAFLESHAPDCQKPDDITIQRACEKWGYSDKPARRRLNQMVKDGLLTKHDGVLLDTGRAGTVWRIKSQ